VQTLVVSGLPLIGLVAFYRGSDALASQDRHRRISSSSLFFSPNRPFNELEGRRESTMLGGGGDGGDNTSQTVGGFVVPRVEDVSTGEAA
jgi:hypothetical protein